MSISFEGIGEVTATFLAEENSKVKPGQVVCITSNDTVGLGTAGTVPCGVAATVSEDGCVGVVISGLAEVAYSGDTAPTAGWNNLAADGTGGVKVVTASANAQAAGSTSSQSGHPYLVVSVDSSGKTAVVKL